MSVCAGWRWRLVGDSGRWWEFEPSEWEIEFARKDVSQGEAVVSACGRFREFEPHCGRLEAWCGSELAESFHYTGWEPGRDGTVTLQGEGLFAVAENHRRHMSAGVLTGTAGEVWSQVWQEANTPHPTGLVPSVASGGPVVTLNKARGDLLDGTLSALSTYVVWSQHRGAMYEWLAGEEPEGRALTDDWVSSFDCFPVGEFDAASVATDLLFAYGQDLQSFYEWSADDGGCRLESPRLEFPELTETGIIELANEWGPRLAAPEPVADSVLLNPAATSLDDLLPGVWHTDATGGPLAGYRFNLATAVITGRFACVEQIEAGFDQGDSEVRRRLRS